MKCPHCLESFHEEWQQTYLLADKDDSWNVQYCTCPACERAIIRLAGVKYGNNHWRLVLPKGVSRAPIPQEVEDVKLVNDYNEACQVLSESPQASAALSRRCLQHVLKERAGTHQKDLDNQIQEVLDAGHLPSELAENLHYVRQVGNFGAHPIKGTNTGEIVQVEPGEAEWNLDVVESLIDHYYVKPAIARKKKEALNEKLREAGKPELT